MRRHPVLLVVTVLTAVFLLAPVAIVVGVALNSAEVLEFPPSSLSGRWFAEAVDYDTFRDALVTSVVVALLSTLIALVLGVPATYALQRRAVLGRAALQTAFTSPLIVPELVLGFALFQQFMVRAGLDALPVLVLGHSALLLPYTVRVTGASLAQADPALEEAAEGLGAGPVRTFVRITLPVIAPGIVAAAILSLLTSFNNVPISLLLTDRDATTLPVAMLEYVQTSFTPMIAAVSVLLLAATIVVAVLTERLVGLNRVVGRST
jgi:putative spermidine/putrescine transport system permease protein